MGEADRLERTGRLREAKDWVEVAQAVSTGSASVNEDLARLERTIRERAEGLLRAGDEAMAAKDLVRAADLYERVLSLEPTSERARQALRSLDRMSVLNAIAHGGGGGPAAPSVK